MDENENEMTQHRAYTCVFLGDEQVKQRGHAISYGLWREGHMQRIPDEYLTATVSRKVSWLENTGSDTG
jgi:hypothetical protein